MTLAPDQPDAAASEPMEPADRWLAIGIVCLIIFEFAVVAFILYLVGFPPGVIALLVAVALAISAVSLVVVTRLFWVPWQRAFPAQPIGEDAVSRSWQSVTFGRFGMLNHCLRLTADEQYLHVHPFILFRWFGARRVSFPWDRMKNVRKAFLPDMMRARIDGRSIAGPSWCMKLADSGE